MAVIGNQVILLLRNSHAVYGIFILNLKTVRGVIFLYSLIFMPKWQKGVKK